MELLEEYKILNYLLQAYSRTWMTLLVSPKRLEVGQLQILLLKIHQLLAYTYILEDQLNNQQETLKPHTKMRLKHPVCLKPLELPQLPKNMLVLQVIPKFMVLVLSQLDYMQESENQEQQLLHHKPKTVLQQSKQVVCLSQLEHL